MAVQVRQGSDGGEISRVLIGDEREPKSQLRQPDGRHGQVHPKQRARDHVALHRGRWAIARRQAQRDELIDGAQQEGSGAGSGIENSQAPEIRQD